MTSSKIEGTEVQLPVVRSRLDTPAVVYTKKIMLCTLWSWYMAIIL